MSDHADAAGSVVGPVFRGVKDVTVAAALLRLICTACMALVVELVCEQTARMIKAMEHPFVDVIGHPTGRLIQRRDPYALDIDAVIAAAVRTGTFLEINANPDRRDLNELNARKAVEAGAWVTIDSDAHGVETLANIRYGVATARRAWLTADNVVNTRPWAEVRKLTKRARSA